MEVIEAEQALISCYDELLMNEKTQDEAVSDADVVQEFNSRNCVDRDSRAQNATDCRNLVILQLFRVPNPKSDGSVGNAVGVLTSALRALSAHHNDLMRDIDKSLLIDSLNPKPVSNESIECLGDSGTEGFATETPTPYSTVPVLLSRHEHGQRMVQDVCRIVQSYLRIALHLLRNPPPPATDEEEGDEDLNDVNDVYQPPSSKSLFQQQVEPIAQAAVSVLTVVCDTKICHSPLVRSSLLGLPAALPPYVCPMRPYLTATIKSAWDTCTCIRSLLETCKRVITAIDCASATKDAPSGDLQSALEVHKQCTHKALEGNQLKEMMCTASQVVESVLECLHDVSEETFVDSVGRQAWASHSTYLRNKKVCYTVLYCAILYYIHTVCLSVL
jgi:hypothetical protein